jgi:hypothetical protein
MVKLFLGISNYVVISEADPVIKQKRRLFVVDGSYTAY